MVASYEDFVQFLAQMELLELKNLRPNLQYYET